MMDPFFSRDEFFFLIQLEFQWNTEGYGLEEESSVCPHPVVDKSCLLVIESWVSLSIK